MSNERRSFDLMKERKSRVADLTRKFYVFVKIVKTESIWSMERKEIVCKSSLKEQFNDLKRKAKEKPMEIGVDFRQEVLVEKNVRIDRP